MHFLYHLIFEYEEWTLGWEVVWQSCWSNYFWSNQMFLMINSGMEVCLDQKQLVKVGFIMLTFCNSQCSLCLSLSFCHTHARTHARTHVRTHTPGLLFTALQPHSFRVCCYFFPSAAQSSRTQSVPFSSISRLTTLGMFYEEITTSSQTYCAHTHTHHWLPSSLQAPPPSLSLSSCVLACHAWRNTPMKGQAHQHPPRPQTTLG